MNKSILILFLIILSCEKENNIPIKQIVNTQIENPIEESKLKFLDGLEIKNDHAKLLFIKMLGRKSILMNQENINENKSEKTFSIKRNDHTEVISFNKNEIISYITFNLSFTKRNISDLKYDLIKSQLIEYFKTNIDEKFSPTDSLNFEINSSFNKPSFALQLSYYSNKNNYHLQLNMWLK